MSKQKNRDDRETTVNVRKSALRVFSGLARTHGMTNPDAFEEAVEAWRAKLKKEGK